jgi:hypothetical protein
MHGSMGNDKPVRIYINLPAKMVEVQIRMYLTMN